MTTRSRFQVWVDTTHPLDDEDKAQFAEWLEQALTGAVNVAAAEYADDEEIPT